MKEGTAVSSLGKFVAEHQSERFSQFAVFVMCVFDSSQSSQRRPHWVQDMADVDALETFLSPVLIAMEAQDKTLMRALETFCGVLVAVYSSLYTVEADGREGD